MKKPFRLNKYVQIIPRMQGWRYLENNWVNKDMTVCGWGTTRLKLAKCQNSQSKPESD